MQLNILIIGVLFPSIPLMMISFGNRYSLLAGLIRDLHDTVINEKISTDDSARFFCQIAGPRQRLRLIAIIQTCSSLAFIFTYQLWFRFILASITSAADYFSYQSF